MENEFDEMTDHIAQDEEGDEDGEETPLLNDLIASMRVLLGTASFERRPMGGYDRRQVDRFIEDVFRIYKSIESYCLIHAPRLQEIETQPEVVGQSPVEMEQDMTSSEAIVFHLQSFMEQLSHQFDLERMIESTRLELEDLREEVSSLRKIKRDAEMEYSDIKQNIRFSKERLRQVRNQIDALFRDEQNHEDEI